MFKWVPRPRPSRYPGGRKLHLPLSEPSVCVWKGLELLGLTPSWGSVDSWLLTGQHGQDQGTMAASALPAFWVFHASLGGAALLSLHELVYVRQAFQKGTLQMPSIFFMS